MSVTHFNDPGQFYRRARPLLESGEAENNLMIGNCLGLIEGRVRMHDGIYMATVEDDGIVTAAAMMMPPHNLALASGPTEPLAELVDAVIARSVPIPGVIGPAEQADAFARFWSAGTGKPYTLTMRERIYRLERTIHPAGVPGTLRAATDEDFDLLVQWGWGFFADTAMAPISKGVEATVRTMIDGGRLHVWENGGPLSMACHVGPTPNGVRINFVYTPPEHRGHGYASACVAALSQRLLDGGKRYCFLYTDLSNPTSNSIYQKIGYEPVCDVNMYTL